MKLSRLFRGDKIIWVVFLLLSIFSLVEVYSSIGLYAYSEFDGKSPTSLFLRHLVIVIATYGAILLISRVNYRYFSRFAMLGYWATLVLLAVMLAIQGGRWFRIPIIGQFQPSEIAKVVLIVFVARMLAIKKDHLAELGTFLQILIYILLTVALILPENFSMAALIFVVCYLMMLVGGVKRGYWWRLTGAMVLAAAIVILVMSLKGGNGDESIEGGEVLHRSGIWAERIDNWMHPVDSALTQENMAKMAIARGGALGAGIGNTVHARLMTQAHNDFIYAIIIEETGMVGGIIVFLLYSIFYFRCIRIAWRCKGRFGALMVLGLGTVIFLQAIVNMSVAVGVLPVTGQTLPFISYGGTAYLFLGCGLGIIQSVAADVYSRPDSSEESESVPQEIRVSNNQAIKQSEV